MTHLPEDWIKSVLNHRSWVTFLAILFGVLCLYFSQFSLTFTVYDSEVNIPWALLFPVIIALAAGKRASLITAFSGGALYPFLIWEDNGWLNIFTSFTIALYLFLLGYLSELKRNPTRSKDLKVVLFWVVPLFFIILWGFYLYLYPYIIQFNPPLWAPNSISYYPPELLFTFAFKNSINFIYIAFFCETALRVPSIRRLFQLETPHWMRQNTVVFFICILVAMAVWLSIYILDSLLLPEGVKILANYHILSFMVISLSSGMIGRTMIGYLESNLKAKQFLRQSQDQLNTIIDNIPSVIYRCLLDDNRTMKMISPQIKKITGYSASSFVHEDPLIYSDIIHPDDKEFVHQSIFKQLKNDRGFEVEYRIIHQRGALRWVSDKGIVKRDSPNEPSYIDGVIDDITIRKNDEEEIKKYKTHLEELVATRTIKLQKTNKELKEAMVELKSMQSHLVQSEKMASLGVLTAGVAHEINNPLNHIIGGLTGLEAHFDNGETPEEVKGMLANIKNGVWRASNIVRGLNQFSRSNNVDNEHCDIHSIILNCINMLDYELKEKVMIKTHFTESPYLIIGNVGKLHQVFLNILNNAYQAIDEQGNITISTSVFEDHMHIAIADTGNGIAPEDLKKNYRPIFHNKRTR